MRYRPYWIAATGFGTGCCLECSMPPVYSPGLSPRAPAWFSEFMQLRSRCWDAICCNRCGASRLAVSAGPAWRVESGHEFAVGGAGGGEVFIAFVELLSKVEVVLFELADALMEGIDICGDAEPGLAPGLFTERFGQPLLQLLDAGAEPGCSSGTGSACSTWIFSSRSRCR